MSRRALEALAAADRARPGSSAAPCATALLGRPTERLRRRRRGRRRSRSRARLARATARRRVRALGGRSARWRVVARDRTWQVDLAAARADDTIEADLASATSPSTRSPSRCAAASCIDPLGGAEDLAAGACGWSRRRRSPTTRCASLRLARLAVRARLRARRRTPRRRPRARAPALAGVAAERVFAELQADRGRRAGARRAGADGRARASPTCVLPELSALHGVEQSRYHHLDVHRPHARRCSRETIELERDPRRVGSASTRDRSPRCSPSRSPTSSRAGRRCASARCCTTSPSRRRATSPPTGRVTFIGHDAAGARAGARAALHAAARQRAAARPRRRAHPPPPAARLPRARACRSTAAPCTATCARLRARRGRRHAADRRRPPRHARARAPTRRSPRTSSSRASCSAEALALARRPAAAAGPRRRARARRWASRRHRSSAALLAELEEASFAGEIATRDEAIELGPRAAVGAGGTGAVAGGAGAVGSRA